MARIRQWTGKDWWMLFQAILILPILHFGLNVLGYARLRGKMEKLVPLKIRSISPVEPTTVQRAQEIARIVCAAARYGVYRATCLRNSLLTWWFLRREGIDSQICFGVRLLNHKLEAHAWVEHMGIVINDAVEVRSVFQVLDSTLPPTERGL